MAVSNVLIHLTFLFMLLFQRYICSSGCSLFVLYLSNACLLQRLLLLGTFSVAVEQFTTIHLRSMYVTVLFPQQKIIHHSSFIRTTVVTELICKKDVLQICVPYIF